MIIMNLIGVVHKNEYLEALISIIKDRYPNGPLSLMLEIPTDLPEVVYNAYGKNFSIKDKDRYSCVPNFFGPLALYYDSGGTRIIFGDIGRQIRIKDKKPKSTGYTRALVDHLFFHKRDRAMTDIIMKERPEVVVVGRLHADYIKKQIPDAHYIVIEDKISYYLGPKPHRPDELFLIETNSDATWQLWKP